jgi:hypothetical protein
MPRHPDPGPMLIALALFAAGVVLIVFALLIPLFIFAERLGERSTRG